jgi:hypothetical protein
MYVKEQIKLIFNNKEIGDIDFVIGIKFEKCIDGYIMHQRQYIKDLINKFKIIDNSSVRNLKPIVNTKLRKNNYDENSLQKCSWKSTLFSNRY